MNDSIVSGDGSLNVELDRLTDLCADIRLMAKSQRIEIEAAAHQAVALGVFTAEDYETIRLAFLGGLHRTDDLAARLQVACEMRHAVRRRAIAQKLER
ncbi:hypothetical protein [Belnapia sp. F-4-1]|uniref:hypothetical protein n=1 Tax=Belnapia sp. F-4-1 TaxID=1545443 RepID=UPI001186698A|nr:hypothetical protein [Belnapia sp. F-4-1]